jgi:hypothetical protein
MNVGKYLGHNVMTDFKSKRITNLLFLYSIVVPS